MLLETGIVVRGIALLVAMSVVSTTTAPANVDDRRAPVPTPEQVAEAQRLVTAIYKDEIGAPTRSRQMELGRKLLQRSREERTDAAMKFALLGLARDTAGAAGDEATAFAAIDELTRDFDVDAATARIEFLQPRVAKTGAAETLGRYVEFLLRDLPARFEADDLATADRLIGYAQVVATKAADPEATLLVSQSRLQSAQLQADRDAYGAANVTLGRDSSDPHANFVAGFHLGVLLRRWDRGLKLLVLGDNPEFAGAAGLELKAPSTCDARVQVADRWFDVAARQPPFAQLAIRAHSAVWYRRACFDSKEPDRARVLKRLAEIDPPPPPKATLKLDPADWRLYRRTDGKWQSNSVDGESCRSKGAVFSVRNPGDPNGFAKLAFMPSTFGGDFTIWLKYRGQLRAVSLGDTLWQEHVVYVDRLHCDRTTWRSLVFRRTREGVTAWIDGAPELVKLWDSDEFITGLLCVELNNGQEVDLRDLSIRGGSPN